MNDFKMAMDVQSACNLKGVLRSMVEMADKYPPHHPILRLFAEQVIFLAGGHGDAHTYAKAYQAIYDQLQAAEKAKAA